jgi:uncharacterized RmlC-like cupin family protein
MTAVRSVAEFKSLREGFEKSPCRPFVVRRAEEFLSTPFEVVLERFRTSKELVFGYDGSGNYVEDLALSALVEQWLGDRLDVKVLDSPMHIIDLPPVMDEFASTPPNTETPEEGSFATRVYAHKHGQSPVLTRADAYTPFHVDPPDFGGGWMYLWRGRKTWHFVSQEWITTLFQRSTGEIQDASIQEMHGLDPRIECYSTTAGAGDFIYFPPGWIHRVWTHEKSLGIGGYFQPESARSEYLHAMEQLQVLGKDFVW